MKRYLIVLAAAVSLSCARSTINYNDVISEMYSCHDTAQWTAPEMFDALPGTYDWRYVQAWGRGGSYESESDYLGWTLTLNADSTYSVDGADTVVYEGNWSLENSWYSFTLDLDTSVSTLWGQIVYCPPYLMFYNSPVDGPDHLYEKR
ncbi:MAG: hypothetical protein DA396_06735 [Bacteroidetes bacterium]|nr:MAG: hypothetical protein DA396_06735 [Bacteroidota bacterium]PTM16775.1 MAG: hypothetical protein DA444_07450 [Bacteroidota bacterium]